ncbi:MAG: hypothetical protein AAGU19_05820 [Prolixibacteraceae bacterium]
MIGMISWILGWSKSNGLANTVLFVLENEVDIEFKWNDNMQENGNIMDFYVNGDTAPGGRFNFVYTAR